jgi:hypothetical protein
MNLIKLSYYKTIFFSFIVSFVFFSFTYAEDNDIGLSKIKPTQTSDQPTNISIVHRDGQTFITWNERTDIQDEQYRLYQHISPITSSNIAETQLLATLPEGTSIYYTERQRAMDYPPASNGGYTSLQNYIITDLGNELSDTTGLFVWTAQTEQESYYAITTVQNGLENLSDFTSDNTYGPVVESIDEPSPILVWQSDNGRGRVYTQFMDYANWNPTYETPDGLTYAYNYFVGLPSSDQCAGITPDSYALLLHIEGYGSRYGAGDGSHYFCAIEVWCDDPRQSWYYGYSATHDYSNPESTVTTGPIVNFTEQRLLRAVHDTIRDPLYNIDENRIYSYGHSMGASGSLALALRYPNVFAAVYCSEPMTNYQEASTGAQVDWVGTDLEMKWGSVELNLPIENRGMYAAPITQYNNMGVYDWQNHQANLVNREQDEIAFVSLAHGTLDRVIAWESQGRLAYEPFYQSRRAFSGEIVEADHTWIGFNGMSPTVETNWDDIGGPFFHFQVRRNESLPAMTYAINSLPVPPDTTGGYNMNLEWSSSWNNWAGAPVDTTDRWEVAIRSLSGGQFVDITPRRLQNFQVIPGRFYSMESRNLNSDVLMENLIQKANENGILTFERVLITENGNHISVVLIDEDVTPIVTPTRIPWDPFPPTSTPAADTPTPETPPTNTPTATGPDQPQATPTTNPICSGPVDIPIVIQNPQSDTHSFPVTVGIPLTNTDISLDALTITASSGPIPTQIREISNLGSIRWILIDFQAEQNEEYRLIEGNRPEVETPVQTMSIDDGSLVVNTGAGYYIISNTSNLLGAVENASGIEMISGASWGMDSVSATIETIDSGSLRTMVCLRAQQAIHGLDLVARIHFFAGLPYIRCQLTLVNHNRAQWGYEVPNADNGDCEVAEGQPILQGLNSPGTIVFDDITWSLQLPNPIEGEEIIYQDSSGTDQWDLYVGQGPRMQSGVTRRGYVHLQNGDEIAAGDSAPDSFVHSGIHVEMPWFSESFPKAYRARNNQLEISLFPSEYSIDHRLRAGEQKTHDVWLSLDPSITPPTHVTAHPSLDYLRCSEGLGFIGPRREGQFEEYEDYMDAQFDEDREHRDGFSESVDDAQIQWDYFGWMDFGDIPTDFEDGRSPYNLKYDVALGFIHQGIRTNDWNWWKWAEIGNRHFADIDIFHTTIRGYDTERTWVDGGAWGHSLHNETGLTNPHRNCNNPNPDLTYGVTGMIAWSLLTGDQVTREAALEMADNLLWRWRNSGNDPSAASAWGGGNGQGWGTGGLRGLANVQRALVWAWKLTGDSNYLEAAGRAAHWYMLESDQFTAASWPTALLSRSMGEYILAARSAGVPEDSDAIPAMEHILNAMANNITRQGDRIWFSGVTGNEINAWMLLAADGFALGYAATENRTWFDDYAVPSFNTGSRDPFYEGDIPEYHSSKELVGSVPAGTIFIHFADLLQAAPIDTPTPGDATATPTPVNPTNTPTQDSPVDPTNTPTPYLDIPGTIYLQQENLPDTNYNGCQDAVITDLWQTNTQLGGWDMLGTFRDESERHRILIQFNMSFIPTESRVHSATLSLYHIQHVDATGERPQTINIHRLTTPWIEGTGDNPYPLDTYFPDGVTWIYATRDIAWTQPGGDFRPNNHEYNRHPCLYRTRVDRFFHHRPGTTVDSTTRFELWNDLTNSRYRMGRPPLLQQR